MGNQTSKLQLYRQICYTSELSSSSFIHPAMSAGIGRKWWFFSFENTELLLLKVLPGYLLMVFLFSFTKQRSDTFTKSSSFLMFPIALFQKTYQLSGIDCSGQCREWEVCQNHILATSDELCWVKKPSLSKTELDSINRKQHTSYQSCSSEDTKQNGLRLNHQKRLKMRGEH